jgi:hypothetical protein
LRFEKFALRPQNESFRVMGRVESVSDSESLLHPLFGF